MEAKLYLSAKEVSALTGWSLPTVYKLMRLPGFPVVRMGRGSRIPAGMFSDWMEQQAAEANPVEGVR